MSRQALYEIQRQTQIVHKRVGQLLEKNKPIPEDLKGFLRGLEFASAIVELEMEQPGCPEPVHVNSGAPG